MFSSHHQLMIDIFPNVVTHVKEKDVIFFLVLCVACIVSFNLWMSRAKYETFAMVVNNSWEPTHVIVDVFEVHNQSLQPWPSRLRFCFDPFDLFNKGIIYVKDNGSNLRTLTNALA